MHQNREGELELEPAPCVLIGRVLLAKFRLGQADQSRILRHAAEAWRDVGGPISLWAVVDSALDLPAQEAGLALQRASSFLANYCESLLLIVPGNDVRRILARSTWRGLIMTSVTNKALRVRVVEDFAAAVRWAGDPALVAADIERAARVGGVVEREEQLGRAVVPR